MVSTSATPHARTATVAPARRSRLRFLLLLALAVGVDGAVADAPLHRVSMKLVSEQTVRDLLEAVELSDEACEQALSAFVEYRAEAERQRERAQRAFAELKSD